jgi:Tol biopolymer transport system component
MRQSIYRLLAMILVAAALCSFTAESADAQAWWFGKNKVQYETFHWEVLKTPHFDIHFHDGYRDLAGRTAVILEYGYGKLSIDFDHHIGWRIPVILYASHSYFQQTNTTWGLLPEGVQAFAEPARKRMVLHFSGTNEDFAHTAIHELTHMFEFDIIYGSLLRSAFAQGALFNIPLWFAEGISEYYSVGGMDATARMFMRDATVFDYLPYDLDYAGGYMNYKAGQSAINYINETYGSGKVVEIMDQLRYQRSLEAALRSTLGIGTRELSKAWKDDLRRKYWPEYADKNEPEEYGRRLTDHVKDHSYQNIKPEFSPDGEHIIFYSDRGGLDGIYLMNAISGRIEKKMLTGSLSEKFESIRSMKSSLAWAPDGKSIAFVAKSDGRDRLFILSVPKGRILDEIEIPVDFFFSPTISPDGKLVAFVGTSKGKTDLYVLDLETGTTTRVTDDMNDETDPAWFPYGRRIAYSRAPLVAVQPTFVPDSTGVDRLSGVDLQLSDNVLEVETDIWAVDVETGVKELLISTPGNDSAPLIINGGEEIIFTSDETDVSNIYRGNLINGAYYRFTDVLGGLFTPSYSEERDRLVFSAFNQGGYDLFVMEQFSEKSSVSYSTGSPLFTRKRSEARPFGQVPDYGIRLPEPVSSGVALENPTDSLLNMIDLSGKLLNEGDRFLSGTVNAEVSGKGTKPPEGSGLPDKGIEQDVPYIVINEDSKEGMNPDSLKAKRELMSKKIGTIEPYRLKFQPDYIGNGLGLFFSTGLGFGLANQVAFSDLLGDHHIFLQFGLYGSLEDSDIMLSYYYLKRRLDYSFGIFQFKNYLNSRVSSIGEIFTNYRYFTERNYGIFGNVSFPFSMFTRVDLELQAFISEREFFVTQDMIGTPEADYYLANPTSQRRLFQPTLSLVHDSSYYGAFGPVIGERWMISASRAVGFSDRDLSRTTILLDYRRYFPLWYRNSFALRAVTSMSEGSDKRFYYLGGPLTLRGYDYLQFQGPRMFLVNLEYRYPLIDALIFGWPGRWGIGNIGGTLFLDTGSVWGKPVFIEWMDPKLKPREINGLDFWSDFGVGFYMRFGYMVLDFQVGWPTDFRYTGSPAYQFYIGPQF